jgi:hypothetical protein
MQLDQKQHDPGTAAVQIALDRLRVRRHGRPRRAAVCLHRRRAQPARCAERGLEVPTFLGRTASVAGRTIGRDAHRRFARHHAHRGEHRGADAQADHIAT